jgi:hypothetical protein
MGPGGYGMMGPGMMGPGYGTMMGPGMMGYGWGRQGSGPLGANDVQSYLERWVATTGNTNLKVGTVTEKDANTISAEIVSKEKGTLIQRYSIDRNTGYYRLAP